MVALPERAVDPAFAAALIVAAPEPFPPPDTESHDAPLDELHVQPLIVLTWIVAAPPVALMAAFDGATENVQGAGAWLKGTAIPFTATEPLLAAGAGFAATRTPIDALPCPLVSPSVIHEVSVDADQVQSRVASTLTVASAPPAGAVAIELVAVTAHFVPVGAVTFVFDDVHPAANTATQKARTNDVSRM